MHQAYVSIGSNIDPEENIRGALRDLRAQFGPLQISGVYASSAIGFDGNDFFNLAVGFETDDAPIRVAEQLRKIEAAHGRTRDGPKFSPRTLDLDLLIYDSLITSEQGLKLPRDEILTHAFVLRPLAEIAGERVHPQTGLTFTEHWRRFNDPAQTLTLINVPGLVAAR